MAVALASAAFALNSNVSVAYRESLFVVCLAANLLCLCSANKHRCKVYFHSGNLVYINTAHFCLPPGLFRKLAPKWVGPFPTEQVILSVAYCVSLNEEYGHIHPVFYVSSLHGQQGPPPSHAPPIFPIADSSEPEYKVEDILA